MPWQALPVELVLRILEALDPQVLVNCRRTSRLVKSLIDGTIALQYRIALYSSGMVDGPPGQLDTSERLSLLRSYEASWKNLDWNAHTCLPVPGGSLWELYGNVWAHSGVDDTILFVQLPSRLRGITMRQWTLKLDHAPRDFSMDPSQDLLVTIDGTMNAPHYRIRLLTLSTGEKHRLTKDTATIECTRGVPANLDIRWSYSIRVNKDYVGVLSINNDDVDENELVVWNWKTGAINLRVTLMGMLSFTFLGNNFILVSASIPHPLDDGRPALILYNLDQHEEETHAHLLRFLFPTPYPAHGHSAILLTSDPSSSWSSSPGLQVPFQIPCDERIIALNLHRFYRGDAHSETLLVPASNLLCHVGDIPVGGEGRDIEWESWGPPCIERVPYQGGWSVYTCFLFGMRHILPTAARRGDRRVMIVRDLCQRRRTRASEDEREESNALHQAMGCEEPYPRSIVKCVPLPKSIRDSSNVHLMIGEDGIVALEYDLATGNNLIHLLTF